MTNTLRAAAAAAGELSTCRGDARRQEFKTQLRAAETTIGDKTFVVLDGHASTTEQPYTMYDMFGEYKEVIDRGAFNLTLSQSPNVNFLVNHTGLSMARTTAGTLDLDVDDIGLHSVARLNPQRSDVQDLRHAVEDGALDEMSFAFRITDGQWSPDYTEFRILAVDLDRGDVSAVNYGANPYTSISARAKQAFEAIDHLEGEPLRMAAARAQARLADQSGVVQPAVTLPPITTIVYTESGAPVEPAKRGRNIRTLRALLELDEER